MNILELKAWLIAEGFHTAPVQLPKSYNSVGWYAYRRTLIPSRNCECNDDKRLHIVVQPCEFALNGVSHDSCEVELFGQYGTWWKLMSYGHSFEEVCKRLPDIEAKLIRAWNALEAPK